MNIWLVETYHPNPQVRARELSGLGLSPTDVYRRIVDEARDASDAAYEEERLREKALDARLHRRPISN